MKISSETMVGEVVRSNFKTARLFMENKMDYCCGGNRTISEACSSAGVRPESFIKQLERVTEQTDPDAEYINNLKLRELCSYIVKRHHNYIQYSLPFLKESLGKIVDKHGVHHPELVTIKRMFDESAGALTVHMQKEEIMLFPYIERLEKAREDNEAVGQSPFGSVSNPVKMMVSEHETEGERFDKIARLSNNYKVPDDACATYKITMEHLRDFESDLHRHIHLENNILFPGAVELEAQLIAGNSGG